MGGGFYLATLKQGCVRVGLVKVESNHGTGVFSAPLAGVVGKEIGPERRPLDYSRFDSSNRDSIVRYSKHLSEAHLGRGVTSQEISRHAACGN